SRSWPWRHPATAFQCAACGAGRGMGVDILHFNRHDWARAFGALAPGFFVALTVAAAANFVAVAYGGPVMLLALLIGIALNFVSADENSRAGLRFASRPVLQTGVALLGLNISVAQVVDLGAQTVILVIGGV